MRLVNKKEKAVAYMVYSSLFLSLLNFSVKGCVGPLGVPLLTFVRCFSPLLLAFPFLIIYRKWSDLKPTIGLGFHLLRSFFAVTGQISLNYYLTKVSLVDATMLWATGPIYLPDA